MQNLNSLPEEVSILESIPMNQSHSMPVIRIDSNGKILFANEASISILNEILSQSKDYFPADFINRIPGMLSLNADFSAPVEVSSQIMMFDVIGFKECGYIGLYGFTSQENNDKPLSN